MNNNRNVSESMQWPSHQNDFLRGITIIWSTSSSNMYRSVVLNFTRVNFSGFFIRATLTRSYYHKKSAAMTRDAGRSIIGGGGGGAHITYSYIVLCPINFF